MRFPVAFLTSLLLAGAAAPPLSAQTGVLVVAHGADSTWNNRVHATVAQVKWDGPVTVAFLMGPETKTAGWNEGVAKLVKDGAKQIVVVPLMVSSFGGHYEQIRFYAGEVKALPPELAAHDHGQHEAPPVPMQVTPALDAAPELADAIAARWGELGAADRKRPLMVVGHGPNEPDNVAHWIKNLTAVTAPLGAKSGQDVRVGLLRDDAPAAVRAAAVAAMRDTVIALAARSRDSVVVFPLMISAGDITRVKIPKDFADLPVRFAPSSLTPQAAIARWIEASARGATAEKVKLSGSR